MLRLLVVGGMVALVAVDLYRRWTKAEAFELQLRPGWLLAAGACYLAGWLPAALWWRRVIRAMGPQPALISALRAYYVGHLGKYIPGKALVVLLRGVLLRREHISFAIAATAAVYETLTTMAVGALVAGLLLFTIPSNQLGWLGRSAGLLMLSGVAVIPPVFNRLLHGLSLLLRRSEPLAIEGLGFGSLAIGVLGLSIGWALVGLSLGATLQGIGGSPAGLMDTAVRDWPLWTASTALAVVAGFLFLWAPAGVGVREYVLVTLLAPTVGSALAVGVAVVWRFVSLASEAAAGALLYPLPTGPQETSPQGASVEAEQQEGQERNQQGRPLRS